MAKRTRPVSEEVMKPPRPETFLEAARKLPWLFVPPHSGWYVVRFKNGSEDDYILAEVAKDPGVSGYVFRTRDRPLWQPVRDDARWLSVDESASS